MFLPGSIDYWVNIVNFGHLGITELPRKHLLAFADMCMKNCMFFLVKSYYFNVTWGLRMFYKGLGPFLSDETR